jgi:hypothetical protein
VHFDGSLDQVMGRFRIVLTFQVHFQFLLAVDSQLSGVRARLKWFVMVFVDDRDMGLPLDAAILCESIGAEPNLLCFTASFVFGLITAQRFEWCAQLGIELDHGTLSLK